MVAMCQDQLAREFLVRALCKEGAYFHWLARGRPPADDWTDGFWAVDEIKDIN